jgi:hypothetical protein
MEIQPDGLKIALDSVRSKFREITKNGNKMLEVVKSQGIW